jgi:hypothetical protein
MTLTGFNAPYSHMYRKYINHIYLPLSSSSPSPSHYDLPFNMICFTFLCFIV